MMMPLEHIEPTIYTLLMLSQNITDGSNYLIDFSTNFIEIT